MAIRIEPGRDPETSPHCPKCGYNLFGLTELRCPECGCEIVDTDDLESARLLATANKADRRAISNERIAGIVGAVFWVAGTILGVLAIVSVRPFGSFWAFRTVMSCILGSLAYLYYEHRCGETIHTTLFVVGLLWFVVAFAIYGS